MPLLRLPAALFTLIALCQAVTAATADPIGERLRYRLEFAGADGAVTAANQRVHTTAVLHGFYARRGYDPAWIDEDGGLNARAEELVSVIDRVDDTDGLNPADYHARALALLAVRSPGTGTPAARAVAVDTELLLTDAWLLLAAHLLNGRLDPRTIDAEWTAANREMDLPEALDRALATDDVTASLAAMRPAHDAYRRMAEALVDLRATNAAGGWPTVSPGPALRQGDTGPRVAELRQRLGVPGATADAFDDGLDAALRAFQRRHGLDTDGVAGRDTLAALNVSAAERAAQIRVNMERWRWLQREPGDPRIEVDIADFHLAVIENDRVVFERPVIVGRPYRRTPVFSGTLRYLVLNPSWEVPSSIARKDILPQVQADPGYLERMGMRVLDGWGVNEEPVDPAAVDWAAVDAKRFPYRIRQAPGPQNALGQVKFMFPNEHSVYLHDTPARELFGRPERAFSSGCIRVSDPHALTEYLLARNGDWPRERIDRVVASGATTTVPLKRTVPVHLRYRTAWVARDGTLQFRRDLYDRDGRVARALDSDPPG